MEEVLPGEAPPLSAEQKEAAARAADAKKADRIKAQREGFFEWDHVVRQWVEDRLDETEDYFNSTKLELVTFSDRGRGLRAKENIPRGTLLLVERPLAYQKVDRSLAGPSQRPPPLEEAMLERAKADATVAKKLATLLDVKPAAVLADTSLIRRLAVTHGWTLHHTSVFEAIRDQSALYNRGSYFNHSCEPNTVPAFFGPVMVCFAVTDIGKGSEVTAPYCDVARNYKTRRALLQKWGFDCMCKRCVREENGRQLDFMERLEEAYMELRDRETPAPLGQVANLVESVKKVAGADFLLARVLMMGARMAQMQKDKSAQAHYLAQLSDKQIASPLRAAESGSIARECIYRGYVAERMAPNDDEDDSDEWYMVTRRWLALEVFDEALNEFTFRALRASFYQYKRKMEQQRQGPDEDDQDTGDSAQ